ncbi:MAG: hypothetical protein U9O41_03445 [Candidatus Aerophobetes bacterium]|nr:hypothetical protein [Candidatus Aerophobetes bacterium]
MKKTILVSVVSLLFMFALASIAWTFQNEPEGFRGIKWGDPLGEDMIFYAKTEGNDDLLWYKKENDKMQIGEAKLKKIIYGFYKSRFMEVRIEADECRDRDSLEDVVKLKFGDGKESINWTNGIVTLYEYEWSGNIATVILWRIPFTLQIRSTKIRDENEEDARRKEEEKRHRKEEERRKAAEEGLDDF